MTLVRALLLAVALLTAGVDGARAQAADPIAVARDAIGQLRSPYCPGLMLEVCPSLPAELLRDSIHALAAAGAESDQIVEWMLARHGEEWRAVPQRRGVGLWAWIAPPAVLVIGAGLLWGRVYALRARPAPYTAAPPLSDADRRELEAALHAFDAERDEQ